jgi:hypothetical protein
LGFPLIYKTGNLDFHDWFFPRHLPILIGPVQYFKRTGDAAHVRKPIGNYDGHVFHDETFAQRYMQNVVQIAPTECLFHTM